MTRTRVALAVLAAAILASPATTSAGDAFFKGGLTFHPESWTLLGGIRW